MNVTHKAISAYRIKMQNCIARWRGEGKDTITQEELAQCMNVKIGVSFRRHIAEMQSENLVQRFTYQTDKGGYRVAYLIH